CCISRIVLYRDQRYSDESDENADSLQSCHTFPENDTGQQNCGRRIERGEDRGNSKTPAMCRQHEESVSRYIERTCQQHERKRGQFGQELLASDHAERLHNEERGEAGSREG